MFDAIILSCEHAGNQIPAEWAHLFEGAELDLVSHKGYDIGAYSMAIKLSERLNVPLFNTEISRLLVETNRSLHARDLFSKYSKDLPKEVKNHFLEHYYTPYRMQVEQAIVQNIKLNRKVLHLSIHSFTPVLDGEVRNADIGLLFDEEIDLELKYCRKLHKSLTEENQDWRVQNNYPYKGTDDGFTTYLRTKFNSELYAGVEIEINQAFPEAGGDAWQNFQAEFVNAVKGSL